LYIVLEQLTDNARSSTVIKTGKNHLITLGIINI